MADKIRYVTCRKGASSERWYWQRKGWPLTRLPDDPTERLVTAARLNSKADAAAAVKAPAEGSIRWVVDKYTSSPAYQALAEGTLKYYRRYLKEISDLGPNTPFAAFDRRTVIDYIESYDAAHERRQAAAVLRNLFETALYYQVTDANHASNLRLEVTNPRDRWWTPDEISRWLDAAPDHPKGAAMEMAFYLLFYTAQRPGDVLTMPWSAWDRARGSISLQQQKTRKSVNIPAHPRLQNRLERGWEQATGQTIVEHNRAPLGYTAFLTAFGEIRKAAGVADDAQPRDLRRTAALAMAEAGATETQIAAVTGHSIEHTRQILETYIPRTLRLASEGVGRLRDIGNRNI